MAFKLVALFATLAYASAGYLEPVTTYASAPLTYSSYAAPALSYSSPAFSYGYDHPASTLAYSAPIAQSYAVGPAHSYSAPIARTYAAAPALTYARSYAPALAYNNYGYSSYAAPLATKTVSVAQPATIAHSRPTAVLATRSALTYAPAHAASYTNSYMNYNSPLITYAY